MNKTAFALAAAIAASASAAIAEPVVEATPSIVVSFADLDISHPAGRATLENRVSHAVMRLCGMPAAADLEAMSQYRSCRRTAWAGARLQLAAIYGRTLYAGPAPLEVAAK
jgi:UrcA family protein